MECVENAHYENCNLCNLHSLPIHRFPAERDPFSSGSALGTREGRGNKTNELLRRQQSQSRWKWFENRSRWPAGPAHRKYPVFVPKLNPGACWAWDCTSWKVRNSRLMSSPMRRMEARLPQR